jgi:hypothetical protein
VADSAYPCTRGFLPPYKGERYHLNTYRNRPLPRGYAHQIQDIMTSPKQLPLKWPNLEKALHKQCGIPVMDTRMREI